jgi:hypothetical protein
VIQRGGGTRFALKALEHGSVGGKSIGQEFQGNEAIQAGVFGFIDDTHASSTKPFVDAVMRDGLALQRLGSGHFWSVLLGGSLPHLTGDCKGTAAEESIATEARSAQREEKRRQNLHCARGKRGKTPGLRSFVASAFALRARRTIAPQDDSGFFVESRIRREALLAYAQTRIPQGLKESV